VRIRLPTTVPHTHTHTHTHTLTRTITRTLTHTHTHTLTSAHSHAHTLTFTLTHSLTHTVQLYDKTQKEIFASAAILFPVAYACRVLLVLYWQRTVCRLHAGKGAKVGRQLAHLQYQSPGRRWPQMALQQDRVSTEFSNGRLSTASAVLPEPSANTLNVILGINTNYSHREN